MILAETMGPSPETVWNAVTVAGPVAIILGTGLVVVFRLYMAQVTENKALREQYTQKLDEMRGRYEVELRQIQERLFNALNNSTISTSTASQTTETLKSAVEAVRMSLGVILDFISRVRRDEK